MKAKKFATQVDEKVLKELRKYATEADRSISVVVTEAIAEYLQKVRVRPTFMNAAKEVMTTNRELLKKLAK